ncbi:hypothetical protein C8034_v011765 [Colletotrichum sidae]|uniref:Uncharacterized protein n=1 Tax=Colletotrichum sidae TaxID=1347389 RepID=A0A4R8TIJ8_9PEZI|nr:hypothetical protein C8034_v011765 [Colletotrichum sidae]
MPALSLPTSFSVPSPSSDQFPTRSRLPPPISKGSLSRHRPSTPAWPFTTHLLFSSTIPVCFTPLPQDLAILSTAWQTSVLLDHLAPNVSYSLVAAAASPPASLLATLYPRR